MLKISLDTKAKVKVGDYSRGGLVTNVDFDARGDYLCDPPRTMAFLGRIGDGAIILQISGRYYRAHRGRSSKTNPAPKR